MKTIDINCDMGESFGRYKIGMDEKVMPFITSANIACGFHAGDPVVMDRTIKLAAEHNVSIGAHPGYPDLLGFGRRSMALTPEEIHHYIVYQLGAVQAFCRIHGTYLNHVKPHGALYLDAVENKIIARAIARAIIDVNPELYFVALAGKKGEAMQQVGEETGLKVVYEAFPDRAYSPEGTLVSRKEPGAVISDPDTVARRAIDMASGFIKAVDGTPLKLEAQTLCVHGDNSTAVELVKTIKTNLEASNITVKSMGKKQ